MKLEVKQNCPLDGFNPCKQFDCAWFMKIDGTNPNNGKPTEEWGMRHGVAAHSYDRERSTISSDWRCCRIVQKRNGSVKQSSTGPFGLNSQIQS